jgi:hypothetical protein
VCYVQLHNMKFEIGHPELMFGSNIESAAGPLQRGGFWILLWILTSQRDTDLVSASASVVRRLWSVVTPFT